MEKMGRQKLVDKTIVPQEGGPMPQQMAGLTVAQALQNRMGVYLLGGYKGQTVFVDLDKLVNQPLVNVEKQYILGILNGGTSGVDALQIVVPDGAEVDTTARARLTVPSGQVWFVHAVVVQHDDAHTTGVVAVNWRCSLWPSRQDPPDEDGQAFYVTPKAGGTGAVLADQIAKFHTGAIGTDDDANFVLTNKDVSLRLPAGATITLTTNVTTEIDGGDVTVGLQLYGYVGKLLVA